MKTKRKIVLLYDLPMKGIYHTIHGSTNKQLKNGDTIPITFKRIRVGQKRVRREKCLGIVQNSNSDYYFIIIPDDYNEKQEGNK